MIHVFWSRQIIQLDKPIELKIYEWNTGGLLTRIGVIKKSIYLIFCRLLLLIVVQLQCFISSLMFSSTTFQWLRAFLLKFELMDRTNTFTDLKNDIRNNQIFVSGHRY
jgi:small subunit ribosomal protein S1